MYSTRHHHARFGNIFINKCCKRTVEVVVNFMTRDCTSSFASSTTTLRRIWVPVCVFCAWEAIAIAWLESSPAHVSSSVGTAAPLVADFVFLFFNIDLTVWCACPKYFVKEFSSHWCGRSWWYVATKHYVHENFRHTTNVFTVPPKNMCTLG